MRVLVADTSALVSLAATSEARELALPLFLDGYDVAVPQQVIDELEEIAEYEDDHANAARAVLDERDRLAIHDVEPNSEFPLDDGENAAIQLTTEIDAAFFYCDEYNQLALIHASLSDTQLVTTPRVLDAFIAHGDLSNAEARDLFERISGVRSWDGNAYVQQAARLFD
jgi:predicted nucleic acid-binding protein